MRCFDDLRSFRRGAVVAALGLLSAVVAVSALAAFSACASDDASAPAPTAEAGADAPLLGETAAPDADADIPLGDVCGDAKGLENGAPWPMRGGCPKRAGVASGAGPQSATVKWSVSLAAGESSPAIGADRLLWVGTVDGDVVVVSAGGVVQAALRTGGAVKSSPVRSATGLSVIGSTDGALYGVDRFGETADDGGTDAEAGSPDDGGTDAGDDEAGAGVRPARAVFMLPLTTILSSPAIGGDGTIYVSSSDHMLYAFTPQGAMKWLFDAGAAIAGSPVVGGDGTIYVGTSGGTLHAIAPDGKARWAYAAGGAIAGAPCVRAGVVYVGSDDKKLHAVATPTGAPKWTFATLGAVATPVVGVDGTVYVGSADGKLYALTPSGLLYFAVNAKGRIHSAPAIGDDGTLYVTTDTALVAIGP